MINTIVIDGIHYNKATVKELVKYLKCAFDSCLHSKDFESAKRFKHIGLLLVNYGMNLNASSEACSFQECLGWFTSHEENVKSLRDFVKDSYGFEIYEKEGSKFFNDTTTGNTYCFDTDKKDWVNIINGNLYPN
jgi:hypothetical protein